MDIAVPPFAPSLEWVGEAPAPVERICTRGPLLVHFIDVAHPSSVRTLPYLSAWHERYSPHGLTVVGVNSPRFPSRASGRSWRRRWSASTFRFPWPWTASIGPGTTTGARMAFALPLEPRRGAPLVSVRRGRVLGDRGRDPGELLAVSPPSSLPPPLEPLRPSDAPGALVSRPTDEVLPGGSTSEPWRPGRPEDTL